MEKIKIKCSQRTKTFHGTCLLEKKSGFKRKRKEGQILVQEVKDSKSLEGSWNDQENLKVLSRVSKVPNKLKSSEKKTVKVAALLNARVGEFQLPKRVCIVANASKLNCQPKTTVTPSQIPTTCAASGDGLLTTPIFDMQMSPKKALRVAMLQTHFADTILKAQ
ncbi:hypothetical protein REPUB_Repub03eG0185400 [Reevesia pubescens]